MKILAIGSHPDDIEYGCGGMLLNLKKKENAELFFYVATCGECAGGEDVRKKEQEAAVDFLGVSKIYWGGFRDTALVTGRELIDSLEKVISDVTPEMIMVNYPEDTHQDHRSLAESTVIAARYCRKVLYYEDFTSRHYEPYFFVDIGDELEDKMKLLKFHKSQVEREYPTGLDIAESSRAVASFRGFQAKVKYAEGFSALRFLLDIGS